MATIGASQQAYPASLHRLQDSGAIPIRHSYRVPETVLVDSCLALHIKHKRTTPYHPQANIIERVNRNVNFRLIALTERHRDWDKHIAEMGFAIRNTVNRLTGFPPAFSNLGKEIPSPLENGLRSNKGTPGLPLSRYAEELTNHLSEALHDARDDLDAVRIEQAAQYDKSHR